MTISISITTSSYDTYDTLIAAIPDYLDGQVDTTQVAGWVGLIEKEINRRLALNPVRPQLTREAVSLDSEFITLPDDFLREETLEFTDDTVRKAIRFVDYTGLSDDAANPIPDTWLFETTTDYTGAPEVAAVIEGEMRLYPVPDATYSGTLLYYAKLDPISESNQSNWFLTAHTDVYLYGLLFHANTFLPDKPTAQQWFELFDSRLEQVLSSYPRTPIRRKLRSDIPYGRRYR